ncbi:hypothetical protein ACFQ61_31995 [Streptomyces sp. NPDC056500]|uniref:hypothetical protein n=1 Tax=Streptomyces sp. NPDC056500 TaxID=3345840 RepID=UPI0036A7455A
MIRRLTAVSTAALLTTTLFTGSALAADTPGKEANALPTTGPETPGPVDKQSARAATLPFNFTFEFRGVLRARSFTPPGRESRGKACVSLRGTWSDDPNWKGKIVKVRMLEERSGPDRVKGPEVDFKLDGTYYKYCWTGLTVARLHHFDITKPWGPAVLRGDGSATPR